MFGDRRRTWLLGFFLAASAYGQTPPIQLQTPDVKIPAPLLLPAPNQREIGAQPLSVDEAVSIALMQQPQVLIAKANLLSEQGRTQRVSSSLYPQIGLGAGITGQHTIRTADGKSGSNANLVSGSLSADQLLFDFGLTRNQVRQQSAVELSRRWSLKRTLETVTLQVKLAFYDLVQSRIDVATSEANVANRQRQLDQATALSKSGLGTPSDVVQAKANLADAAISLTLARRSALGAQVALAQVLGIDPRTPITAAASRERALEEESDLERLALDVLNNRADIKAAQEQLSAAGYALAVAHLSNAPRVSASANVNGQGQRDFSGQTSSLGVSVIWSFGDGGLQAGKVKEALGNQQAARQVLIDTTNQAVSDVSDAFLDLQSALQRVELAQVGSANAMELVRVAEGRYRGGIGQFIDITNAQSTLFTSQRNLNQAQQDVERARARLRAATGMP